MIRFVKSSPLLGAAATLALATGCSGGSAEEPVRSGVEFAPARLVSSDTENGATPMFLITHAGDRVLSWVSAPGGGSDGRLHFSVVPAGSSEALPVAELADPIGPIQAHGEAPPQVAVDPAGSIYVLYSVGKEVPGQRFPVSALRFARSDDLGRTWSAPVTVNAEGKFGEFGSHNFHALTVGTDGRIVATWLDSRSGTSGVWMSQSTDGGRSWEADRPIYRDASCPCCRTAVAIAPDGSMYVAWRAILEGDVRDVVVMRSADGGRTWGDAVRPVEHGWVYPGCPHAGPDLAVDAAGRLHIAYWTGQAGSAGVYYARSDDRGQTFVSHPIAVGETARPAHVQLALADSAGVVVAWDDGHSAVPRVLIRRSRDGGASFAATQEVSEEGVAASFPVVAVHHDSLAVAWSQTTAAAHHEAAAAKPDMKDPTAVQALPRVGQSEIFLRQGRLPS